MAPRIKQGQERRAATQDANLAAAEAPARTTRLSTGPLVSVAMTDNRHVGRTERAIAQALEFGGEVLQHTFKKQQQSDALAGQAAIARGQTVEDLRASGASVATLSGAHAATVARDVSTEHAETVANMQDFAAMSPEEFEQRQQLAFSSAYDKVPEDQRELFMGMKLKSTQQLAGMHATMHNEYKVQESKDMFSDTITATAVGGDVELAKGLIKNVMAGAVPGLNETDAKQLVVDSVTKSLQQGDETVLRMFSDGEFSIKDMNLTSRQASAIRVAKKSYDTTKADVANKEFTLEQTNLRNTHRENAENGTYAPEQFYDDMSALYTKHNIPVTSKVTAAWSNIMQTLDKTADTQLAGTAKEREATLWDTPNGRELMKNIAQQEAALAETITDPVNADKSDEYMRLIMDKAVDDKKQLSDDAGMSDLWVKDDAQKIINTWSKGVASVASATRAANRTNIVAQNKARKGAEFYSGQSNGSDMTPAQIQKAMLTGREQIWKDAAVEAQANPGQEEAIFDAATQQVTANWSRLRRVDNNLAEVITMAMDGPITDKNGAILPDVARAADLFNTMYQANPKLALKHIKTDNARILATAVTGKDRDAQTALVKASQGVSNLNVATGADVTQYRPQISAEVSTAVEDRLTNFFGMELYGNFAVMASTTNDYADMLPSEVASLRTGVPEIAKLAETETMRMARAAPGQSISVLTQAATDKVMSTLTPMGGSWIKTVPGQPSIAEQAGLHTSEVQNVEHQALMYLLREEVASGWGGEKADRNAWDNLKSFMYFGTAAAGIDELLFDAAPEQLETIYRGIPKISYVQDMSGTTGVVQMHFDDGTSSSKLVVPHAKLGGAWKRAMTK